MERIGFKMQLLPNKAQEYEKRHNEIWPELTEALKEAGIHNYSIFLDPSSDALFAVLDREDEQRMSALAEQPIMRKWWDAMAELMETHEDNEPIIHPLHLVFHLA